MPTTELVRGCQLTPALLEPVTVPPADRSRIVINLQKIGLDLNCIQITGLDFQQLG